MTSLLDPLSVVRIDIPTQQEEGLVQKSSLWNRITTMQTSQKGVLVSLGVCSICTAFAAIAVFSESDPLPDRLMPSFISSAVVAKNAQQWSFLIISLATTSATMLYTKYFLKNQQQVENAITPEMASIIENCVEQEMINATPGPNGLQILS